MLDFLRKLLSVQDFMPHGMCYSWNGAVLWLNVIADGLIAASFYAIPFLLFRFIRKRRDISFNWIFAAFGMFILACGATHLLGAVTVWTPVYRLEGVVKGITAVASLSTFLLLIPVMPTLISLPSPQELARANQTLAAEIAERRSAEAEVLRVNEDLEARVASRTAEQAVAAQSLERALSDLRQEMEHRRELEEQLIQAQKMEAMGRLAGGVAHDFNNLLTVILGYNEMLREQVKGDAMAADFSEEVLRASERASALTSQLLAFSRRQENAPQLVDLNPTVQHIDRMLRRIIGEDIRVEVRLAAELSPVKVDPSQMDQVIMNLAVNARDAMPRGGDLTLETANVDLTEEYAAKHLGVRPGPYVMLAVSDTGTGMDAATRARIFEPFFTTKEQGKGTGLGLSIVYGIVKQNGGEIRVYSEPGQGTVFKVYLPVASASEPAPAAWSEATDAPQCTETILLVEDEQQVRTLTRTVLDRQGYRILEAATPVEALRLLREHPEPIDLLLTDIVMPQMSGMDLAKEAAAVRPGIRVLYMSGYTDNSVVAQGMISAQAPFLPKPFTQAGLQRKVREVLRS